MDKLITVYIPSHNYGMYLDKAVKSILSQTYNNWELLIINDGSTDNTSEIMLKYQDNPKIELVNSNGIGLPAVCNLALNKARGDYIIRLDADDLANENLLLVLANSLNENPNLACVFPDYYYIDDFDDVYAHQVRPKIDNKKLMYDYPPNGACTLIKTSVLRKIGGYREDLGAQDGFDFWSKIIKDYEIKNIDLPLFYYRRHNSNLTNNSNKIQFAKRRIKRDFIKDEVLNFLPITAIIPCREGYDFLPNIWKEKINGKALIDYSIESCLNSNLINKIIITCDNLEVEKYIKKFKDEKICFYPRSKKSTIRESNLVPLISEIINGIDKDLNGITIIRYIQAPFISNESLEEAITTLIMNEVETVYGVETINSRLFKKTPDGLIPLNPQKDLISDFDTIYKESNTVNAILNRALLSKENKKINTSCIEISSPESFFINSNRDLKIANLISDI